ncbi:MAG: hypothetical protein AB1512_20230 [Thermodesulfobacteriota bacterium]
MNPEPRTLKPEPWTSLMSILCVTDQGASLTKRGSRLQVEKAGKTIQWIHAFRVGQIVLMGNIQVYGVGVVREEEEVVIVSRKEEVRRWKSEVTKGPGTSDFSLPASHFSYALL